MYGIQDPRLIEEHLPYTCVPLWNMFWALHSTRQVGMGGMQPITFSEIKAYAELMQTTLEPYEVEIVKGMDRAFLNRINIKTEVK